MTMQLLLLAITLPTLLLLTTNATPASSRSRHHHHNKTSALLSPAATSTSPTAPSPTSCHAKIFDLPWILSDISIFTPADQQNGTGSTHGTISFHFCDENEHLQLETDCSGTVINGYCGTPDGGYVVCENSDVAFKLVGGVMMLVRGYVDDCLGPWPYNFGEAFGQNETRLDVARRPAGTMATQEQLLVEITEMA